jgi:hypothetical protein
MVLPLNRTGGNAWTEALPSLFSPELIVLRTSFLGCPCFSTEAWNWDMEMMSYVYVFTPDYATALKGISVTPCGSGYSNTLGPCSFLRLGLVPTANSHGYSLPDVQKSPRYTQSHRVLGMKTWLKLNCL